MSLRYYEAELRYLHEAGKAFAAAHPDRARYLNIDAVEDRDPYVERLFEGFALLSGRVHERLDDDLPEYTQRLVGLLYPQFLKAVPSCAMVELRPREGQVGGAALVPAGTEILSDAVGDEKTVCRFRTTQDVTVQPLAVEATRTDYAADETSTLAVDFRCARGSSLAELDLGALRLFVSADSPTAATAWWMLTRHAVRVEAAPLPPAGREAGEPEPLLSRRGGLSPAALGEPLLPHGPETPAGLRLLQEYLVFRPKLMQADLPDLSALQDAVPDADGFRITVHFDRAYPEARQLQADAVRLFCTPAVNLFELDAEPARLDHTRSEVAVRPDVKRPRTVVGYDVQEVVGSEVATGARRAYRRAFSAEAIRAARDIGQRDDAGTFEVLRRPDAFGRPGLVLTLANADIERGDPPAETLSVAIRATNDSLPHEALRAGSLSRMAPDAPQFVEPANLAQPTLVRYPPLGEARDLFWSLLAHWSFHHGSVASTEAVVGLLELYDWVRSEGDRRRWRGIQEVRWAPKEIVRRGAVRRGAEVTLAVADGHFADEADLSVFGLVLSEFLSLYATLNAFVHLTIETVPSGRRLTWQPERGARPVV